MRNHKKILYIGLAVLSALILLTIVIWTITRDETYFVLMGILAVLFLAYFILLIAMNARSGWRDENTAYARTRTKENLLLHVYPYKRNSYIIAAYEPYDEKTFAQWLEAHFEEEDADMWPVDCVYIGWTKMKRHELATLENKSIVFPEETEAELRADEKIAPLFKKNTIRTYKLHD